MRYRKGSIELSLSHDLPLLRQILRSEFTTHAQLFEFMRLNHIERSRKSFDWRLRRLVKHGFVVQRRAPIYGAQPAYSIGRSGALLLQGRGEYCLFGLHSRNWNGAEPGALHALELNEIHLSALRSGVLARWIPAAEIRSQNELTGFGYAKDYDAIVAVRTDAGDRRFALEYERSPKAAKFYRAIAASLSEEFNINRILYLVPNYDLVRFISAFFTNPKFSAYFGLVRDWHEHLLDMPVSRYAMTSGPRLRDILDPPHPETGSEVQRPLFSSASVP